MASSPERGVSSEQPAHATAPPQPRLSLKLKLSLLITSLLVLTLLLISAFLLRQQQKNLTAEITKRGHTIAQNLAASAKGPILTNDELTLNLLVKDALKDNDVAYVIVTDTKGKILAHQDVARIGKALVRPLELRPLGDELLVQGSIEPDGGRLIDFAVPLEFAKVRLGALYVGFSERSIEAALRRVRNQTLMISAVIVLVGIGGAVALATVLSRPILRLVEGTRTIASGNLQVALAVPSRDEIGTLTAAFNQMAKSLREKEMIKRAFSRYVAREVVDEILKDPERMVLTGERRVVTVLFCDIRGFTPLAARLSPEEVVLLLNEFYTLMIDTTFKHDGTLDKFLGDGIMAIFGAPIPLERHAFRAIETALAIQAGVAELAQKRLRDGKDPIAVGIGISSGEVVAGTVGTEERMEYTVIGDSVNLAARLESYALPGQILISQQTCRNAEDRVLTRPLQLNLRRKGEQQIAVYEVLGLAQAG